MRASPGTRGATSTPAPRCAQLAGSEIAWLADPVDAMILQIQGSGRLRVTEADGSQRLVRLAFAGTNNQPYRSPGGWLLGQGAIQDATWPGIKAWLAAHPERLQDFLWSNPRVVFFREQALSALDEQFGPGARRAWRSRRALDRRRPAEHPLRHAGVAGLQRPGGQPAAPGAGAGHRQRHPRRRARRLLCRLGRRGGRLRGPHEAALEAVGPMAEMTPPLRRCAALRSG
jgi:hypothetical protein